MANLAVLASGNGSNFQAIAEAVAQSPHMLCCLVCDRAGAYVLERARRLDIPGYLVPYRGRSRSEAERDILNRLAERRVDLVVLAGFMRLLTPQVVDAYPERIVNIHPSLLPKHPGTHAIEESYEAGESVMGITVHRVDYGMDTGPIICQRSFRRTMNESLTEIEERIHELEHITYPEVVITILDEIEASRQIVANGKRGTE